MYGVVALFSYVFGGPLADRYQPKKLISTALLLTALGGLVLASYPSYFMLQWLYGYWGFTTVFLFWGAMIKATRIWGSGTHQGRAFGFLEGGRGLVAALMGSAGVFLFSFMLPEQDSTHFIAQQEAFRYVILLSSLMVALAGIAVYFFMDKQPIPVENKDKTPQPLRQISTLLKNESLWLLMLIIFCAYFGYKVTDNYSLFAFDVLGFDALKAANISALQMYLRPMAAIAFGFLADQSISIKWVRRGFIILWVGALLFASGAIDKGDDLLFYFSLVILATGTYAVRALYFSLLKEGHILLAQTGAAVGLLSLFGYMPDIFAGPLMGFFLDQYPGITGHQYIFYLLLGFTTVGWLAAFRYSKLIK